MKNKIAYIEYNLVHDEIIPIWIYISNKLGLYLDIYLPQINLKRNVFTLLEANNDSNQSEHTYRVYPLEFQNPHNVRDSPPVEVEKLINANNYSHIILGTERPYSNITKFLAYPVAHKSIVVHNIEGIKQFRNQNPGALEDVNLIVLSDFLVTKLPKSIPISPIYLGYHLDRTFTTGKMKQFAVQGNVHYNRRNYLGLLDTVSELAEKGYDFKIVILGRTTDYFGSPNQNGIDFVKKIKEQNLENYFIYYKKEIDYPTFFRHMIETDYLIPLIDNSYPHPYFANSVTSSINMAIAFNCIPIINEDLRKVYKIDFGYVYQNNNLTEAMESCLKSTPENDLTHYRKCCQWKERKLNQNINHFETLLNNLSTPLITMSIEQ